VNSLNIFRETVTIGDKEISIETGKIAKQADGSVTVAQGGNLVLVTVVSAKETRPGQDFFPLTVEYLEKMSAIGKIPGGYVKREGKTQDHEILNCRLIDRSIRPLFPDTYQNETQLIATVLSADSNSDIVILAMLGACASLHLSDIPWDGPAGAIRIIRRGGKLQAMPNLDEIELAELNMVISFSRDGAIMVEGEGKQVAEADVVEALSFARQQISPFLNLLDSLRAKAGQPKRPLAVGNEIAVKELCDQVRAEWQPKIEAALLQPDKKSRKIAVEARKKELTGAVEGEPEEWPALKPEAFENIKRETLRGYILRHQKRIDGRRLDEIRPIWGEVSWLQFAHGSAIFTRGETQALVTCTLGTREDEQIVSALSGSKRESFLLHYNFPPYSVGEIKALRGAGRREIGHGKLAHKSLAAVLPNFADFPYVLRIVSDIAESNGSSSMATVCGGCLALMDAGVPLKNPVAGIAMGLIKEGGEYLILSDILGDEDHLGDMDFKVAGSRDGITAVQLDNKLGSIDEAVLVRALEQARLGRLHILGEILKILPAPRPKLSAYAPAVLVTHIRPERIRELIGPQGKNIQEIQYKTNSKVEVDESGCVRIYAVNRPNGERALNLVKYSAADPILGRLYKGTLVKKIDAGAFVQILAGCDGFLQLSDYPAGKVQEGESIWVRVSGVDRMGRLNLAYVEAGLAIAEIPEVVI
jgi:polyribonucleotide nucleotidyltransferase